MVVRSCFASLAVSLVVAGCAVPTGGGEESPSSASVVTADAGARDVVVFQSQAEADTYAEASAPGHLRPEMKKTTCTQYDAATFYILTGIMTKYGGAICE